MAKKAKRPAPVQNVSPGANPHERNNSGRGLGNLMGAVCFLMFIIFDELWIGNLAFGLGFAVLFGLQVFQEKSKKWYASVYLYAALGTLALAYAEYQYDFVSNLLNFR